MTVLTVSCCRRPKRKKKLCFIVEGQRGTKPQCFIPEGLKGTKQHCIRQKAPEEQNNIAFLQNAQEEQNKCALLQKVQKEQNYSALQQKAQEEQNKSAFFAEGAAGIHNTLCVSAILTQPSSYYHSCCIVFSSFTTLWTTSVQ